MDKISNVQLGQMMKVAAESLRSQFEEIKQLKEKVGQYEVKDRAEKIASAMEEKGLEPELSFEEKVSKLLKRDNLDVIEEAVGLSAPQAKLASVHNDDTVVVEGGEGNDAANTFAANLATLE